MQEHITQEYFTSDGKKKIANFNDNHKIHVGNLFEGKKDDAIESILNKWLILCRDQVQGQAQGGKNKDCAYLVLKEEYVYIGKRRNDYAGKEVYGEFDTSTISSGAFKKIEKKLAEAKKAEEEAKKAEEEPQKQEEESKKQEEAKKEEEENKKTKPDTKVRVGRVIETNNPQAFTSSDQSENQVNAFTSSDNGVNDKKGIEGDSSNDDIESNDSKGNDKKDIEDDNEKAIPAKNEEDKNYDIKDILFVPTYQRDKISTDDSLINQHIIHWSEEKEEELKHNPYPCLPINDEGQVKFVYFKDNELDYNLRKELNEVVNELFKNDDSWKNDKGIRFEAILSEFQDEQKKQQIKNHFAKHFNNCSKDLNKKTVAWKDEYGKHHFQFGEGEDSPKGFFVPYGKEANNEYIYIQWEGGKLKEECEVFTCENLNNPAQSCMIATNKTITLQQNGNEYHDSKVKINATSLIETKSNDINNASFDSVVQEKSNEINNSHGDLRKRKDTPDTPDTPNNIVAEPKETLATKQKEDYSKITVYG